MTSDHYTYHVAWSPEDAEYVGTCAEFPSLSWLTDHPQTALAGIRHVVGGVLDDMHTAGELAP